MFRWLTTLTFLVFGLVSLLGCAAGDAAAAKTPAALHREYRGQADSLQSGTTAASESAPRETSFEEDSLGVDVAAAGARDAKTAPAVNFHSAPPPTTTTNPTPNAKPAGPSFGSQAPHVSDLIIYTAVVTMAVYQVEPGLDAVEKIARELNGYLAQRSDKQITVRVPRAKFDEALRRVQASGDVIHRDVSAEDVTDQYVELETRLKNARAMRDRLEQLLARAAVKEAVEIEKELGRVTGDIEAMEGKLKVLRDKIAYSTITVSFEPRGGSAVRDVPLRLPFGWLGDLGLPRLLSLGEGQ